MTRVFLSKPPGKPSVNIIKNLVWGGIMTRTEVVNFMLGCEELFFFVRSQGGMAQLTIQERRGVELYQNLLSMLVTGRECDYEQHLYKEAA
jgi:hypothetical protein